MKPKFWINRLGAQNKSLTFDVILNDELLTDIVNRLTGQSLYEVEWIEKRNEGRLITLETDDTVYYVNLSQYGLIQSRNNYFQSVATALRIYLQGKKKTQKKCIFYFYFLPFSGNNKTDYMKFIYRIMRTIGIYFLNSDYGLKGVVLSEFTSVKDIITTRNLLRNANSSNKSTYITDEGTCYHIYGKTFGANQKETTLLCFALSMLTDKPLKLFQIIDNDSDALSKNDINAIYEFSIENKSKGFEIVDESLMFDEKETTELSTDNLRSPKFIYNLLDKFNGEKKCSLCECKIESIVQAAHIYPVSAIRKRADLSYEEKLEIATDGDNGLWLCENHHKLFDRNIIWFENGKIVVSSKLNSFDILFVEHITTIDEIQPEYINEKMLSYFDMRMKAYAQ